MKKDILEPFKELHEPGYFVRFLNSSFLVLIAKVGGAYNIKDFRPINLVGSIYKLIAEILVRRMSKVMDKVVGKCQHASIGDRQVLDVALITNEVVEALMHKRRKEVQCKRDMGKTQNHVNWSFLDYLLMRMEFGERWRRWIKSCITTMSFALMVNGGLSSFFKASRGLRGDPLSPLLFIVVMEVLNKIVIRDRELELFKSRKVEGGKHVKEIIYLFFANILNYFMSPIKELCSISSAYC